nr:hypothetical protein [Succinivibrio sp.]
EHKPILEKPGVEKKLKGFLRQSIASLINNPPHRIDQNGIYVYKSQEFRKELETKLTSAIQDMSGFLKKSTQLNQRDGNVLAALEELDKSLEEKQTEFENDQAEVSKFMQKIEGQSAVLDAIIQKLNSAEKK